MYYLRRLAVQFSFKTYNSSPRPLAEYGSGIRLADYGSGISVPECVLVVLVVVLVVLVMVLVVVVASHY